MWEMKKDNTAGMWQQKKRTMAVSNLSNRRGIQAHALTFKIFTDYRHLRHHLIPLE